MLGKILFLALAVTLASAFTPDEDAGVPPVVPEPRQSTCDVQFTFTGSMTSALLRSPNYPNDYPPNLNCKYNITSPAGTKMSINCADFNVEYATGCQYDAFTLSATGDLSFSDGQKVCGKGSFVRETTSNKLAVSFKTDPANPSTGGPYKYECTVNVIGTASSSTSSSTATSAPPPASSTSSSASSSSTCTCGNRNENTRIVGGTNATVSEFPWRVALYSPNFGAFCGGTIISANYVLTAAHCCNALSSTDPLYVDVGDYDLSKTDEVANQVVSVDKRTMHSGYNTKTQDQDICMLHLAKPLSFTRTVQPACLPWNMKTATFQGKSVTASGWGTTSSGGDQSVVLKKVDLPVLTTDECKAYYGTSITNNMICTYAQGKDTCQGDSGGSIDYKDPSSSKYYAIGVVSWGVGCAGKDKPGVYVKVTNYLDWIKSTTNGEKFCEV